MTWTTILIIVLGAILKFLMTPPSALVAWVLSKFALHPKLDSKDINVTFNGTQLTEGEKIKFNDYFNEALFLESQHIFPGNEKSFLNPETNIIPFVIKVKSRKKEMNFFVYCNDDNIDVVKQWKKKVACYSLSSEHLQKFTISNSISEKA
ncbi:YfmQ family protein [Psychrobacillus antarcticus]|uniref:YfmQ family protein n=1 Tax=Psychrobacillus antarcticus TaxID=2879115 RepID=UPI002408637E|nr:YfmQ family protein [Psychrobacillus antarcticus]